MGQPDIGVFVFVAAGWLVSLCLHEFAHAYVAYRSGDRSVVERGYLTLNPLRYSDALLSIALPLLFVLVGGLGLPGAAVRVDPEALHGRLRQALVSRDLGSRHRRRGQADSLSTVQPCTLPLTWDATWIVQV